MTHPSVLFVCVRNSGKSLMAAGRCAYGNTGGNDTDACR